MLKDKICAWEATDTETNTFSSGAARPFRYNSSLDKLLASDFFELPYTKKQLKGMEYIGKYADMFTELFEGADVIEPAGKYLKPLRNTFGPDSPICALYAEKAVEPANSNEPAYLYIDFEAMNMRICGWYGELVKGDQLETFEGIAKPFSDAKYVSRLWNNIYGEMLPYSCDELLKAKHIANYKKYFVTLFRRADKIFTYGDTDALFVKTSFGTEVFNFFKVKNVDMSMRIGSRAVSLDKCCKLFGIQLDAPSHHPKYDVKKMMAYMKASEDL